MSETGLQDEAVPREMSSKASRKNEDIPALIESVPEDDVMTTSPSEDFSKPFNEKSSKLENRKYRDPPRSRRVPNLLSGAPLIPGPMTPNFTTHGSPCCGSSQGQAVAIFPNFMLSPSVGLSEDCESSSEDFMRTAMQCAIGIPPLVVDPVYLEECFGVQMAIKNRVRRDKAKPAKAAGKTKVGPPTPAFESRAEDFPSLGGQENRPQQPTAVVETTTSRVKMAPIRFPSKNQLKKNRAADNTPIVS